MIDLLVGAQWQYVFRAVATDGARKVCHQLAALPVDLLKHQSQLLLVLCEGFKGVLEGDVIECFKKENVTRRITHSSILAWKIPWTEDGGPQSME